jgi:hypothetical protein
VQDSSDKNRQEQKEIESVLRRVGRYGTRKRTSLPVGERYDRKFLIRISVVFSILSLAIILAAVFLYFRNGGTAQAASGEAIFSPSSMDSFANETPEELIGALSAEDAVELVRSALQNRDPALVENYFILGASATTPQQAIEVLERLGKSDGHPVGFESLGEILTKGGAVEEVVVFFEANGLPSSRLAQLLFENSRWRIDLDSFTRHASPGWEDILGRECDVAVVRVFVTADSYYNGGRYLEDRWKCYAMASPDVDEILYGYVARGSAQEKAMDWILSNGAGLRRAALEILTTWEPGPKQFEISRVFSDDWFIGETHLDEGF